MILFWDNKYYMGLASSNHTDEIFKPIPVYCYVINYLVGLVFMASFFIGVCLNPFIIMFNWPKRKVIISLLFFLNSGKKVTSLFSQLRDKVVNRRSFIFTPRFDFQNELLPGITDNENDKDAF